MGKVHDRPEGEDDWKHEYSNEGMIHMKPQFVRTLLPATLCQTFGHVKDGVCIIFAVIV